MRKDRVYIIGVSPEGAATLAPSVRRAIKQADHVFGGKRLLQMFDLHDCEKTVIGNNLPALAMQIRNNLGQKKMVVLAAGDPGFFGIAKYLVDNLGRDAVEIIPGISAVQIAFARIKESWEDAVMVSVHSRPVEDIVEIVRGSGKIAILTDGTHTPSVIARTLLEAGIGDCCVYICQDLGSNREQVVGSRLASLKNQEFSPLNVMILMRDKVPGSNVGDRILGIPEDQFHQRIGRSLITKNEVRAVSLARLGLTESGIMWDIGAGSGAISIEASLIAGKGTVFAIEKNQEDVAIARKNVNKFRRPNIKVLLADAPAGLEQLPDPSAVFIGGTGGKMASILDYVCKRLQPGGRIVCNLATLENVSRATSRLKKNGFAAEITLINIARSKDIAGLTRLEPLNPVFIVTGSRSKQKIVRKKRR
jgi:precorrin-6B C5,15-methyltransferase / cobalt-precorrin-6B C5,C15-methyltransferase